MSSDVRAEIQRLVDVFVSDLETLVRRAALETVAQALGTTAPVAAGPRPPIPPRGAPRAPEPRRAARPAPPGRAATADRGSARERGPSSDRVRRSADQIAATAERIVRHVEQNPGARSEDIRAALGLPKNEWQLTAKRLVDTGRLATRGEKRATTYFVKGGATAPADRPTLGIVRRPGRGAPATPPASATPPAADDDAGDDEG